MRGLLEEAELRLIAANSLNETTNALEALKQYT